MEVEVFLIQDLLLNGELMDSTSLASKLQGPAGFSLLPAPRARVMGAHHHTWPL